LQHIKQLVEYITGMDTRIGYPNEHLAGNSSEDISSPLFATAVGLVMNSIANNTQSAYKLEVTQAAPQPRQVVRPIVEEPIVTPIQEVEAPKVEDKINQEVETTKNQIRRSFFDKYVDKIKDFLDNAE